MYSFSHCFAYHFAISPNPVLVELPLIKIGMNALTLLISVNRKLIDTFMINYVPQIRVFLVSPSEVNEERAIALQVLDMLEYDPLFRKGGTGGVSIHTIAVTL